MNARKLELATASQAKEKQLLVQLRAYFKQEPLKAITAKRIIDYRTWRAEQKIGRQADVLSTLNVGHSAASPEAGASSGRVLRTIYARSESRAPSGRALTEEEQATASQNGCNAA